jgi:hypothetical protein
VRDPGNDERGREKQCMTEKAHDDLSDEDVDVTTVQGSAAGLCQAPSAGVMPGAGRDPACCPCVTYDRVRSEVSATLFPSSDSTPSLGEDKTKRLPLGSLFV